MNTEERREEILRRLKQAAKPLSGSFLARELQVSRQIIVGDISILRAKGTAVFATPRGYVIPSEEQQARGVMATLVCRHDEAGMERELEIIVDNGAHVRDVLVEHPVYGEIRCDLFIENRRDVKSFLEKMRRFQAHPLMVVTGGEHLHTILAPDGKALEDICGELRREGILVEEQTKS